MSSQNFKETYKNFILSRRDSILKSCTTVLTVSTQSLFKGSSIKSHTQVNPELTKKWAHVVDSISLPLSTNFRETLFIYFETLSMCIEYVIYNPHNLGLGGYTNSNTTSYISDELKRIHQEVIARSRRSKVIDRYFNYNTGKFELQLEDGTFIPEGGIPPTINLDLSVFPKEFLPLIDESEFRNAKIDQII